MRTPDKRMRRNLMEELDMRKAVLAAIVASTAVALFLSVGSWAHQPGGSGMPQQGAAQPYGGQGYGMSPGMMGMMRGGMMRGMSPGWMGMGPGMMGHGRGAYGMMGFGMGGSGRLALLKRSLNLTDEQLNTIRSTLSEARKDTIKKAAEMKIAELDLLDMLRSPKTDMTAVKNKLEEIEALRTELRLARIEKHEKVKAVLTTEQLEKFLSSYPWHLESVAMPQK